MHKPATFSRKQCFWTHLFPLFCSFLYSNTILKRNPTHVTTAPHHEKRQPEATNVTRPRPTSRRMLVPGCILAGPTSGKIKWKHKTIRCLSWKPRISFFFLVLKNRPEMYPSLSKMGKPFFTLDNREESKCRKAKKKTKRGKRQTTKHVLGHTALPDIPILN